MLFPSTFWMSVLIPAVFSASIGYQSAHITASTVGKLPSGSWAENLAVRANGKLLVTIYTTPEIYQIDPRGSNEMQLIQEFPIAGGLLGIAEIQPDVFAVVGGNASIPGE